MSAIPMIVASMDSGVSQALLDKMYLQLIVESTHEVAKELTRLGTELALLGNELAGDDELGNHSLANALRVLDSAEDQLRSRRAELAARSSALLTERAKHDAPITDNTLKVA